MNLLIVDDEYYIVQGILRMISKTSLTFEHVFTAYGAEQARRIFKDEQVDFLLVDIEMPKESGLDFVKWLHENNYFPVTIILTSHQRFDYARTALQLGCVDYILKPILLSKLEDGLKKAIEKSSFAAPKDLPQNKADDYDDFVSKVQKYINQNLSSQNLSRDSIADELNLNPDYLSNLFHQKFGKTLTSYILDARIDQAKYYLRHTDMPIAEISEKIGFASPNYLFRQFKKVTGMTTQQYKNQ